MDPELSRRLDRLERMVKMIGEMAAVAIGGLVYLIAVQEAAVRWHLTNTLWVSLVAGTIAIGIVALWRHKMGKM